MALLAEMSGGVITVTRFGGPVMTGLKKNLEGLRGHSSPGACWPTGGHKTNFRYL